MTSVCKKNGGEEAVWLARLCIRLHACQAWALRTSKSLFDDTTQLPRYLKSLVRAIGPSITDSPGSALKSPTSMYSVFLRLIFRPTVSASCSTLVSRACASPLYLPPGYCTVSVHWRALRASTRSWWRVRMSSSSAQGVTLCLADKAGIDVVAVLMALANSEYFTSPSSLQEPLMWLMKSARHSWFVWSLSQSLRVQCGTLVFCVARRQRHFTMSAAWSDLTLCTCLASQSRKEEHHFLRTSMWSRHACLPLGP